MPARIKKGDMVLVMSGIAVLASLTMGVISLMEGSFCPFCVIWYGINAAMFAAAYYARNRNYSWGDLIDDCLGGKGFGAVAIQDLADAVLNPAVFQ